MTIPVGALTAILSVRGAAQARLDLQGVRAAMAETGVAADRAAVGFDRVDTALVGTARASAGAVSAANKLRASQLDQVAAVERYNKVLADENASVAQLAKAEALLIRANERVTASTPIAAGFRGAAGEAEAAAASTSRFGGAMASTLGMAKSLGLLFGAVELVKKSIEITKEANAFQKQMVMIETVSHASAAEVRNMSGALLAMAGSVGTKPEELALSLYHIEQNGLRGSQALNVLKIAAEGAKIGNANLEETTNSMTAAVASGIPGVKNMDQAMGALLATVGTGDMKFQDLNEALGSGLLVKAKAFGLTLRDVGAALAVFGDNNIRGADSATMLVQAMYALAKPAAGGAKALDGIGLSAQTLQQDMQHGGLNKAVTDLNDHLKAAGITGTKTGAFILDAFGRKQSAGITLLLGQYDRLQSKYRELDKGATGFGLAWKATQGTASFALSSLSAEVSSAGIAIARNLTPALTTAATWLGRELPKAFHDLGVIVGPFAHDIGIGLGGAWTVATDAGKAAMAVLGPLVHVLEDFKGPLGEIATVALGAWAAFKGVEIVGGLLTSLGIWLKGAALNVLDFGTSAQATAVKFVGSAGVISATADATAADVAAAGATAEIGWTSVLGPIAAVGVGIGLLVTMFNHSSSASKEATAAAKAYTDALTTSGGTLDSGVFGTIVTQLKNNNVPALIDAVNKSLGSTAYTGSQFAVAIEKGGPALATLRTRLEATALSQKNYLATLGGAGPSYEKGLENIKITETLLGHLNTQYSVLTKTQKKDLIDTKAFSGAASSIDQVAASTQVAKGTATQYLAMLGLLADKNGIVAASSATVTAAINLVSSAYTNATQAGSAFLSALQTFSSSAGTAADRAALIGATLKAANGDALGFAGALSGTTTAIDALTGAFASESQTLANQSAAQVKAEDAIGKAQRGTGTAAARLAAAEARLAQVRGNHKSTAAQVASAEAGVVAAQNAAKNSADALGNAQSAAGKAGSLAYADTEAAAIKFTHTTQGLTASIDTNAKGAGNLVTQLQGIQTAALGAAGAMFQHEVATKGAKQAADDAYNIYVQKTSGALIAEHTQLGLNVGQATALGKAYFGMPKDVKTLIEAEGTNPILDVLNKIGQLLADFTHQPWNVTVTANVNPALTELGKLETGLSHLSAQGAANLTKIAAGAASGRGFASGTSNSPAGWAWVGEQGPELMKLPAGTQVRTNAQSKAMTNSPAAGKAIHIDKLEINYPTPTTVPLGLPKLLRDVNYTLGGVGT